ncbi:MAG: hypothetical protein ACTHKU_01420 [Verrucomicrobiota bacterium]
MKSVVLSVACVQPLFACDFCAVYSAMETRTGEGFRLGVAEQFTHFGTLQEEGHEVPNEVGQYLDSSISQLVVGYNSNDRFGVQLNVPLIYRSFKRPEGFEIDRGHESGIGDVSLVGRYFAFRRLTEESTVLLDVLGGIKFPTGNTARLKEEFNETEIPGAPESGIHGHDLTLGSGSYDGIVGADFYARLKRCFWQTSAQYSIRSEGDYGYRFANDFTWSGGPGALLIMEDQFTLSLQAAVSGETKGRDTFQGEKAADTGITTVYVGPEFTATWNEKISGEIGMDIPVSIDNTALQAVPDYRIHAAVTFRF